MLRTLWEPVPINPLDDGRMSPTRREREDRVPDVFSRSFRLPPTCAPDVPQVSDGRTSVTPQAWSEARSPRRSRIRGVSVRPRNPLRVVVTIKILIFEGLHIKSNYMIGLSIPFYSVKYSTTRHPILDTTKNESSCLFYWHFVRSRSIMNIDILSWLQPPQFPKVLCKGEDELQPSVMKARGYDGFLRIPSSSGLELRYGWASYGTGKSPAVDEKDET